MAGQTSCDIAILGGGLAGGLTALALAQRRPELDILLIEAGERLGGNHIWSFFDADLPEGGLALIAPLVSRSWDGYDVFFPRLERGLYGRYNSIRSAFYDVSLRTFLSPLTGIPVIEASPDRVRMADGRTITAGAVIDARGQADISSLDCGWQSFLGQTLKLAAPHGLKRPIVMDASVEQIGGYRFVYVLPFGETEIFIEDTYYQDGPDIDADALRARIAAYARAKGWTIETVLAEEQGALPVVMGGHVARPALPSVGVRGGFFHPTTGYSLPDAVRTALLIADQPALDAATLKRVLDEHRARVWRERRFYRLLDKMLFRAARPEERYRIFERFYGLPEPLIERFYAGRSTLADKGRILSGRPPVPIGRAMKALIG